MNDIKYLRKFYKGRTSANESLCIPVQNSIEALLRIIQDQESQLKGFYQNLGKFQDSFKGL